jgi:hypothetical protein
MRLELRARRFSTPAPHAASSLTRVELVALFETALECASAPAYSAGARSAPYTQALACHERFQNPVRARTAR